MSFVGLLFILDWVIRSLACESDADEFLRVCGVELCPIR